MPPWSFVFCFSCCLPFSAAGHFCPANSSSATQNSCVPGQYCRVGSSAASECSIGNFCPSPSLQNVCPAGAFCNSSGLTRSFPCQPGYYTPGVGYSAQVGSPAGRFVPSSGRSWVNACPSGYFCNTTGLSAVSDICSFGYYCILNSILPTLCPAGFFGPSLGRGDCDSTTPGNYSTGVGLTVESSFNCEPRFYCAAASTSARAAICPFGLFCPGGGVFFRFCTPGMYCNGGEWSPMGIGLCLKGYFCNPGSAISPCSAGYYCPVAGSISSLGVRNIIPGTCGVRALFALIESRARL